MTSRNDPVRSWSILATAFHRGLPSDLGLPRLDLRVSVTRANMTCALQIQRNYNGRKRAGFQCGWMPPTAGDTKNPECLNFMRALPLTCGVWWRICYCQGCKVALTMEKRRLDLTIGCFGSAV